MKRNSGILLHISSLPNPYGIGSMGHDAYAFVDLLHETKQTLWQILPLGPTGYGNSPYQSFSAFAGNILFVSLEKLIEEGLIREEDLKQMPVLSTKKVEYDLVLKGKTKLLRKAFSAFKKKFNDWKEDYYNFLGEHSWWLDDYALFRAIKGKNEKLCWNEWSEKLKHRDSHEMDVAMHEHAADIYFHRFVQFIFFRQWFALKAYANSKGIRIIGDLPLYVSLDSSDVWGNQDIFLLDEAGQMTHVGGVPPDYFSETGQYWGCPVFDWDRLAERGYDWWAARVHFNLRMFDLIRIDHFRGLESFWAIPASEENAINGKWLPAKGFEMLSLLKSQLGELPVIAEDLGIITPEVEKLRDHFGLPGMKVLQFAYASDASNVNLPHNYNQNFVVYTGTHDNDTTIGWLKTATKEERKNLKRYFSSGWGNIHRSLIEAAWASVANMAILPMQDLMELDGRGRMNTPGTVANNWEWRLEWKLLKSSQKEFLKTLTEKYNRCEPTTD
ncbi:4-alpha-glucanotransferase [Gaoshiqia sediminis]|uniref:4-alpha-glucanotransferase n=1 Tax=Gaoshiqia sediminis TaxID=2986998 RepID=A0AA41Y7S6_9BACT|nr:4-alpha-glucanotransferase [Gaoshiqia sediminis]MCW0483549.1 4-alpha-glucanotransferase [Gaoshiqia sediminis]